MTSPAAARQAGAPERAGIPSGERPAFTWLAAWVDIALRWRSRR